MPLRFYVKSKLRVPKTVLFGKNWFHEESEWQKISEISTLCEILPISSIGASAQWCLISGHHFEVTFSKEDGETTEKQIRNTSVWKKTKVNSLVQISFSATDTVYLVHSVEITEI